MSFAAGAAIGTPDGGRHKLLSCTQGRTERLLSLQVAIDYHPFAKGATAWNVICVLYLAIFSVYWLYGLVHALRDIHAATDIRRFTTQKLGLSESQLKTVSWPEMAKRIVNVRL